jgi:isopenicillin-N N-acyltransferase-like protein
VCLNFLGTSEQAMGVPIHIVLRGILNSRTLPQAVGQITRMDRGTSANYLIAHREGEALDVESTPSNYDALYPEDGWLIHTNHFVGPRMVNIHDTARLNFPDTHLRYGRAAKLLGKRSDNMNIDTFKQIFRDHKGYPDSICRHGEASPPELGRPITGSTVFSIIMNLSTGTFELAKGQPCEVGYDSYGFSERAAVVE